LFDFLLKFPAVFNAFYERTSSMPSPKITYTLTDESPALASYSLLPVIRAYCSAADIDLEMRDISLAGRIIAVFPDYVGAALQQSDDLAFLGELARQAAANIIKLPNISASVPQLVACIQELQQQGYTLPDYPEDPQDEEQAAVKARYAKILGSAVNPVLREGNSTAGWPRP